MRSPLRMFPMAIAGTLALLVGGCEHSHEPETTTLTVFGRYHWDDGTPIPEVWLEAGWIENTCLQNCGSRDKAKFNVEWHGYASTRTNAVGSYELTWQQECSPGSRVEGTLVRLNADEALVYLRARSCTGEASKGLMCTAVPQECSCVVTRP